MKKHRKSFWLGALAATAFFFWRNRPSRKEPDALTHRPDSARPGRATTDSAPADAPREPTADNGHVRDVIATDLPHPATGSNFSVQGDVHEPTTTENKP